MLTATKLTFYDTFFTEIFGHDGTNNYMKHNLDIIGKSIYNASQLSALTFAITPTVRATNIDFF